MNNKWYTVIEVIFLDIRVLNYFLMAAREENITKAANLLHITQPTLSRQLMQLEDELQTKLFIRSNHSIELTESGVMFKRRAQEIVALAEKAKQDISCGSTELYGEISIGSGEFLSVDNFTNILSGFQKEHPLVTYNMYSAVSQNIKERIDSGLLDIGIVFDYIDITKYEYMRLPQKEEWGVLVNEKSPLAQKDFVTADDLKKEKLMLSSGVKSDKVFSDWLGESYENLDVISIYNLMYNAAVMVKNNMGVACCIKLGCKYDGVKFLPLYPKIENRAVFVWKKTYSHSPIVNAFVDYAKKYTKSITDNSK